MSKCIYAEMREERPTSSSCRYTQYCTIKKEYCMNQCGRKDTKSKK